MKYALRAFLYAILFGILILLLGGDVSEYVKQSAKETDVYFAKDRIFEFYTTMFFWSAKAFVLFYILYLYDQKASSIVKNAGKIFIVFVFIYAPYYLFFFKEAITDSYTYTISSTIAKFILPLIGFTILLFLIDRKERNLFEDFGKIFVAFFLYFGFFLLLYSLVGYYGVLPGTDRIFLEKVFVFSQGLIGLFVLSYVMSIIFRLYKLDKTEKSFYNKIKNHKGSENGEKSRRTLFAG